MKIGILKEIIAGERRVAAVPETIQKLIANGYEVIVESGAGIQSHLSDNDYQNAKATVLPNAQAVLDQADIVCKIQRPTFNTQTNTFELAQFKSNTILIAPLYAKQNNEILDYCKKRSLTSFALELIPRIARAQSMDILSSMSNLAGYKSVLIAANHLEKIFPMMTTAAGTITPAKVIVIGAGVAGLQAIATARRLGAVVIAFDTRPPVAEQVKSLGADFVSLETTHETSQDVGGYAKEQTAEFYQAEQAIISRYIKEADVVITTALIPGKNAPILITEEMVASMKPGSIIVDLAAEQAGNCVLTKPGEVIVKHDITIYGTMNLQSELAIDASRLFSRNILAFINYISPQLQANQFDFTDDIIKGCMLSHRGEIIHPGFKENVTTSKG